MISPVEQVRLHHEHPLPSSNRRLQSVEGLLYVLVSLGGSVWFTTELLAQTMSNAFYWPQYNHSGFQGFLIDIVNAHLSPRDALDLLAPTVAKSYADATVRATFSSGFARRVLHTELNSLAAGLDGIRRTSAMRISSIYAQYCWVDLDRRWDIAHTAARAARCLDKYKSNAANYLETTLRNVKWTDFVGANDLSWPVVIANELNKTTDGQQWLRDRPLQSLALALPDEVTYLNSLNLTEFALQWQNDIQMGIADTIAIENAWSLHQTVTTKASSTVFGPWSSVFFYWNFRVDLANFGYLQASVVRGSSSHFETVALMEAMYGLPRVRQQSAFSTVIGPIGSVDALVTPLPRSHRALGNSFNQAVLELLWAATPPWHEAFLQVPTSVKWALTPPAFRSDFPDRGPWTYYGGNLACMNNGGTPFPQSQLAFDDACTHASQFTIQTSNDGLLFALFASGATDAAAICAWTEATPEGSSDKGDCAHAATSALVALQAMPPDLLGPLNKLRQVAELDTPRVHFVQYATRNPSSDDDWVVLRQPLLTPDDPSWSFFGWLALHDWFKGTREVISIEGDVDTVVVMSEPSPEVELDGSGGDGRATGPLIMYYLVVYTTVMAVGLGLLVTVRTISVSFNVHWASLFVFHRVGGLVWIGRPLLLLRGLSAILMLSSTNVGLALLHGQLAKFEFSPRPLIETMVVAGETTWVSYVVYDVLLLVVAREGVVVSRAAAVSSILAWTLTILEEVLTPFRPAVSLQRECTAINSHEGLACTSGVVQVGDWNRVVVLVLVQCACPVLAMVSTWIVFRHQRRVKVDAMSSTPQRRMDTSTSLLLHGAAQAFLHQYRLSSSAWELDNVGCILAGLLPRPSSGLFDIKLWLTVNDPTVAKQYKDTGSLVLQRSTTTFVKRTSTTRSADVANTSTRRQWWRQFVVAGGFVYVVVSATSSVSYIAVTKVNLANDFYWATFNLTGHHVAIANWFNAQLPAGRLHSPSVRLDDRRWHTAGVNYSDPSLQVKSAPWLGPRLHAAHVSSLAHAIEALRTTDACEIPWVFTPYCWVDFGRQWSMAHSAVRQDRCLTNDKANGAVYLESMLRNVDWSVWSQCWGDAFDVAMANELKSSMDGQRWLRTVGALRPPPSVPDEVAHWTAHGIESFSMQWQNYKSPGTTNTYTIENAFGVQYPVTLVRVPAAFRLTLQTTYKMYWGLASDLWTVSHKDANATGVEGKSLVRSSASYAFANTSLQDVLIANATLASPLYETLAWVERHVGPFGVIDMKLVACPASLQAVVAEGMDLVHETLASAVGAADAYANQTADFFITHFAFPTTFMAKPDWLVVGGHLACPETPNMNLLQLPLQLTNRPSTCSQGSYTTFLPSKDTLILAAMAAPVTPDSLDGVCSRHETDPAICIDEYLGRSVAFYTHWTPQKEVERFQSVAANARRDIQRLGVTWLQFVRPTWTSPVEWLGHDLFDPADPTYDAWNWMFAVEWARGEREVVRFEGDVGTIQVLTEWEPPTMQSVDMFEMPSTLATVAHAGVQYVTLVMLSVASLLAVYTVGAAGRIEGWNMLELNRVAGIVWVGRPLLLVRSTTALCLLSTATLELTLTDGAVAGFAVPPLPWYKTVLAASETTWLVYVINDVFMPWTKEFTLYYATGSSALVWFVTAVVTLVSPVIHHATIDVKCHVPRLDWDVVCQSGAVVMGQRQRLVQLVGVVVLCNLVAIVVALALKRRVPSRDGSSLLLSSGAKYLFDHAEWLHEGTYYLDPASALMNGILSVPWRDSIYAVDVKLWRGFAIQVDESVPRRLRSAVPLVD